MISGDSREEGKIATWQSMIMSMVGSESSSKSNDGWVRDARRVGWSNGRFDIGRLTSLLAWR